MCQPENCCLVKQKLLLFNLSVIYLFVFALTKSLPTKWQFFFQIRCANLFIQVDNWGGFRGFGGLVVKPLNEKKKVL